MIIKDQEDFWQCIETGAYYLDGKPEFVVRAKLAELRDALSQFCAGQPDDITTMPLNVFAMQAVSHLVDLLSRTWPDPGRKLWAVPDDGSPFDDDGDAA